MPARCVASSTSPVLGVVVPVDVLAGRSLHSDRVADLNERSTRRGTPGGQSGEAITGRKLRAIPGAPGCPARYEHAGGADTGVAEPEGDHGGVDPSVEQRRRAAVPKDVRMDA